MPIRNLGLSAFHTWHICLAPQSRSVCAFYLFRLSVPHWNFVEQSVDIEANARWILVESFSLSRTCHLRKSTNTTGGCCPSRGPLPGVYPHGSGGEDNRIITVPRCFSTTVFFENSEEEEGGAPSVAGKSEESLPANSGEAVIAVGSVARTAGACGSKYLHRYLEHCKGGW